MIQAYFFSKVMGGGEGIMSSAKTSNAEAILSLPPIRYKNQNPLAKVSNDELSGRVFKQVSCCWDSSYANQSWRLVNRLMGEILDETQNLFPILVYSVNRYQSSHTGYKGILKCRENSHCLWSLNVPSTTLAPVGPPKPPPISNTKCLASWGSGSSLASASPYCPLTSSSCPEWPHSMAEELAYFWHTSCLSLYWWESIDGNEEVKSNLTLLDNLSTVWV